MKKIGELPVRSRCAKQIAGTDADADDCRKDVFLTEARRANVTTA